MVTGKCRLRKHAWALQISAIFCDRKLDVSRILKIAIMCIIHWSFGEIFNVQNTIFYRQWMKFTVSTICFLDWPRIRALPDKLECKHRTNRHNWMQDLRKPGHVWRQVHGNSVFVNGAKKDAVVWNFFHAFFVVAVHTFLIVNPLFM
jgi:hypothetical protein